VWEIGGSEEPRHDGQRDANGNEAPPRRVATTPGPLLERSASSFDEQSVALTIERPIGIGRDTPARREAREALARVLWTPDGHRRLPSERQLVTALNRCAVQDPRDVWWVCEASSPGPVYLLPTREFVAALGDYVRSLGVKRLLEVAAGDGFLSSCLAEACPELEIIATDSGRWSKPEGRMSDDDRRLNAGRSFSGIRAGGHVVKLGAVAAVKRYDPDLVLVSWAPPGLLVEKVIQAPSRLVLDVGVDGDVCGNGQRTWRFEKEFVEGEVEQRALCRLDTQPGRSRHSRLTLYYGRRHELYAVTRR
jgi:hypothetical protein